jgi:hypothetical protein
VRVRALCGGWENPNSSEKNTRVILIRPLSIATHNEALQIFPGDQIALWVLKIIFKW